MTIQIQRLEHLCEKLGLHGIASCYSNLAQVAANEEMSYVDFLEKVLAEENSIRKFKSREMMLKTAGLPYVKTIEQFDLQYNAGIPKKSGSDSE